MSKYRKKPIVIDAWRMEQRDPADDPRTLYEPLPKALLAGNLRYLEWDNDPPIEVYDYLHDTWIKLEWGDWIIRGTKGEFYPIKHEQFVESYEPVPFGG